MKRWIYVWTLLAALPLAAKAQSYKQVLAEKYFANMEYDKAAPMFDELAVTVTKGKSKTRDNNLLRRAAEVHLLISRYDRAAYWYEKLCATSDATDEDRMDYVKVLVMNQNYDEALQVMNTLYATNPDNALLKAYLEQKDFESRLKLDSAFFDVKKLRMNSGYGDFAPVLYQDKLVFASKRNSVTFMNGRYGWDGDNWVNLYIAKKDKHGNYSKSAKLFSKTFVSRYHNGPVTFSKDMKTAYITRDDLSKYYKEDNKNKLHLKLYISRLDESKGKNGTWSKPEEFQYNGKDYSVGHATVTEDGNTVYFVSDMPGGYGETDIWKTRWDGNSWSLPVNLGPKINTPGKEMFPFINHDEKLYFSSDGHVGLGGLDIYEASNITVDPVVENMGYPVNSSLDDFGLSLNASGDMGYFTSNRFTGKKKKNSEPVDNIYSVKISLPVFYMEGVVVDDMKQQPIDEAEVTITNLTTGEKNVVKTDDHGHYTLQLHRNSEYSITASKKDYHPMNEESVKTVNERTSKTFHTKILMDYEFITFTGTVYDQKTMEPLRNASVYIRNVYTGEDAGHLVTDDEGKVKTTLRKNGLYELSTKRNEYMGRLDSVSTEGMIGVAETSKNIGLTKFAKVGDVFVLNHIYYDLGKWSLRSESFTELDKLAGYLKDNPGIRIELSSHTDSRGSKSANQKLSQKRAQSCVDYLISVGIDKSRIIAKGYGETKLVNGCKDGVTCTEEEHQKNRRTEVKILSVN